MTSRDASPGHAASRDASKVRVSMVTALEATSQPLMRYSRLKLHELNMKENLLTTNAELISYDKSSFAAVFAGRKLQHVNNKYIREQR